VKTPGSALMLIMIFHINPKRYTKTSFLVINATQANRHTLKKNSQFLIKFAF